MDDYIGKPTYVIMNFTVIDNEFFLYVDKFYPILLRFSGELLTATQSPIIGSGHLDGNQIVLFKFPSWSHAKNWYDDPEHNEILGHLHRGCKFNTYVPNIFLGDKVIYKGFFIFVETVIMGYWTDAMKK